MRRRNAVVLCAERGSEGVTFDCQLFSFKAERRRRLASEIGFLATSYQIKETQNRLWCSLRACLQALSGSAMTSLSQPWGLLRGLGSLWRGTKLILRASCQLLRLPKHSRLPSGPVRELIVGGYLERNHYSQKTQERTPNPSWSFLTTPPQMQPIWV